MSTSRTQTTTSSSTAGPLGYCQIPITPAQPAFLEDEDLDEDEEEIIRKAEEKVRRMKERKAAAAAAAKQKAEEEAARKAKEEEQVQAAAREERRKRMAEAATARSRRGTFTGEVSSSPRRTIVEIRKIRGKGKERVQAEAAGGDPNDGGDEEEDNEDDRAPWERCRTKKISCQMQAGKRSSIICKPCHDAKVKCSYSGRPSIVKKEVSANPTGERLAILESQVAQLLTDNRQLHDGQVKANTYHRHFNWKLDWLITDAARRRRSPPEMPEAGPSGLLRKRRSVVDSDKEEEMEMEMEKEREKEKDGEGEEEMEKEETAPTEARSDKGKGRAVE
ncbi:MAG: hypothetical protein NXY57DRAFT_967788 [Lentinula lateritia]|nr:MAG: hypothetical protein NXY57DRAFT_967788 [Lentinula lateritia]